MAKKKLMMGNEAVARGAWEAGVHVATAYPGTPATEINEFMMRYEEVDTEWSVNEKVALEVAIGASFGGGRVLCSMKQVGVNVAADPLFSLVYAGVRGGMVIVTADEPGLHSSQNEQDNRFYAKFAQVPMLEPSDAQEAKDMTKLAFELSERHDTPVFLRLTTRICHTMGAVELGERNEVAIKPYEKDPQKHCMVPAYAYQRHFDVEKRQTMLEAVTNTSELNRMEMRSLEYGVVTSGISYQNVREALPEYSVLKIGMTYPVPHQLIRSFASQVKYLYVVEENRAFLEEEIKALGIQVEGKEQLLRIGELSATELRARILKEKTQQKGQAEGVPGRPPQFCPGCGHRGIFHLLQKHKIAVNGDIGCYGLGVLPPYNAVDNLICMGASVGMDHGMGKVKDKSLRSVGILGDSTFFHSGMTNLANLVVNNSSSTILILDNRITAMTGHQPNPSTGKLAGGAETATLDIASICKSLGVKRVFTVDGFDLKALEKRLTEEIECEEPSVIVIKERCIISDRGKAGPAHEVTAECKTCKKCFSIGCPAITFEDGKVRIIDFLCDGCGVCAQVCPFDAIKPKEENK